MSEKRILIITGGSVDKAFFADGRSKADYEKIIAVDGGLQAARDMKLIPDVILGDFDTVSKEVLAEYQKNDNNSLHKPEIIRLKPEKDDTDTQAALSYAAACGVSEIDVLGATGTRLDHTYANLFLLKQAYEMGISMTFYTGLSKIYLISGEKHYRKSDFYGVYISFLQFDGPALGVTLKGFKYELDDFDLDTGKEYRLAVSNEPEAEEAFVTIREGFLLVVESKEDKI